MYCECPEFRRCCFCLPLRRGVLVFAYFNVVVTVLQIVFLHMLRVSIEGMHQVPFQSGAIELPIVLTTVLCALGILFNILLIYGLHTKRTLPVKIYYYFMISMFASTVILEILDVTLSRNDGPFIAYFLFCLVINLYLLFMVRSLITKLDISNNNKFTNQLADFVDGRSDNDRVYTEIVMPKQITINSIAKDIV